jgi:hypothetical protein
MLDCDMMISIEEPRYILPHVKHMQLPIGITRGLKCCGYTGTIAVDYALKKLKAERVLIAGMDLYQSDYFWYEGKPRGDRRTLAEQVELWTHFKNYLDEPWRVVPLSGPLVNVFLGL